MAIVSGASMKVLGMQAARPLRSPDNATQLGTVSRASPACSRYKQPPTHPICTQHLLLSMPPRSAAAAGPARVQSRTCTDAAAGGLGPGAHGGGGSANVSPVVTVKRVGMPP